METFAKNGLTKPLALPRFVIFIDFLLNLSFCRFQFKTSDSETAQSHKR